MIRAQLAINSDPKSQEYDPISAATFSAILGKKDDAFRFLEKAYEDRTGIVFIKIEPQLDNIRSDPRYRGICWTHRSGAVSLDVAAPLCITQKSFYHRGHGGTQHSEPTEVNIPSYALYTFRVIAKQLLAFDIRYSAVGESMLARCLLQPERRGD